MKEEMTQEQIALRGKIMDLIGDNVGASHSFVDGIPDAADAVIQYFASQLGGYSREQVAGVLKEAEDVWPLSEGSDGYSKYNMFRHDVIHFIETRLASLPTPLINNPRKKQ